jgi:hypothetical protein
MKDKSTNIPIFLTTTFEAGENMIAARIAMDVTK